MTTMGEMLVDHQKSMRAYALRLCGRSWVADDLVSMATVSALTRGLPDEPVEDPKKWLNRFVFMSYRSRWNSEKRYSQTDASELVLDQHQDGEQEFALGLKIVAETLAGVPDKQRQAFLLIRVEGYTAREAAEIMGYADHKGVLYQMHKADEAVRLAVDGPVDGSLLRYAA